MKLVILAAGKGTRLGLEDIPKPMVDIGGKPLLEHQILLAKRYGFTEIFIIVGHLSEIIEKHFGDGSKWGVKITYAVMPKLLGTAGSVKLLEGAINERFMVFYGDIVTDFDIEAFVEFDARYAKEYGSIGTTVVHPNDHPYDSDLLETDADSRVVGIIPKPHGGGEYYRNLVNAAVYIFSPEIFQYIAPAGTLQDFGKDVLPKVVEAGGFLAAYSTSEYIKDMGTAERLEEVRADFVSGKVARLNKKNPRPCVFLDRDGIINPNMDTKPLTKDFILLDGVPEAIKEINQSGYLAVVVTNQPMAAKGFVTLDEIEQTNKKMETLLGEAGAYLDKIYFCPHHPEKGFEGEIIELKTDCDCRKPKPGMLLQAQKDLNIDLTRSWMIGDSERDILAGIAAGCKTIAINDIKDADFVVKNLMEAVEKIAHYTNTI